jgi:uncharacterized protein (DUF2062 family)/SAM-dependent methyltransferase
MQEHSRPHRLAAAVAVGILVGCSPFFGLHFWIGLGLALLLRLNKLAVFLGSQISIPPLAPLIGFASVQLGALLLYGELVHLRLDDFNLGNLPALLRQFLLSWLVGGLVVGGVIAAPAYLLTYLILQVRRGKHPHQDQDPEHELVQAAARFAGGPPAHRHYARFKYRMDPVYRQVCDLLGQRDHVVDLGTGLGMLPVLLAQRGQVNRVVGVDWDEAKIRSGKLAAAELPGVELLCQDLREHSMERESTDGVVLIDVLHYWPIEEQRRILSAAAGALRPGGRLVVRETDRLARSWLTRALEAIAVRVGWNRGPGLTYRTEEELRGELGELDLRCGEGEASSSSVHRGNILVWGDRFTAR